MGFAVLAAEDLGRVQVCIIFEAHNNVQGVVALPLQRLGGVCALQGEDGVLLTKTSLAFPCAKVCEDFKSVLDMYMQR